MTHKIETAKCANCGREFRRRSGRSNPRRYCHEERCDKISKIKNSVAKFSDLPNYVSPYRADLDYHGRPYD